MQQMKMFAMLRLVWRPPPPPPPPLSRKTQLTIFFSNSSAVLLFGQEAWRVITVPLNKIQVFMNEYLRSILNTRWLKRIANEKLRIRNLCRWSESAHVSVVGNTSKKAGIEHCLKSWNPLGKRKMGRSVQT